MQHSAFRAYDIRGIVGKNINLEDIFTLGKALVKYLKNRLQDKITVVIARDGRESSPLIYDHIYTAIIQENIEIVGIGIATTPQLYYEEKQLKKSNLDINSVGIMITASHNDAQYNGIKMLINGKSLTSNDIQELYNFYAREKKQQISKINNVSCKPSSYLKHLVDCFQDLKNLDIPLFIDCSNGPASQILGNLCSFLEFQKVILVANDLDAKFRCHKPDPSQDYGRVLFKDKPNGYLGVAFDGDADRVVIIDETNKPVRGDQLLTIFALYTNDQISPDNNLDKNIVADIKCAVALQNHLQENNIKTNWSPSGHGNIKQKVHLHNAKIGGELSGHYCFMDNDNEIFGHDDGIYGFLRTLRIVKKHGLISHLVAKLPNFYSSGEMRILVDEHLPAKKIVEMVNEKLRLETNEYDQIDGLRANIWNCWITLRSSNTENVVSMSIESQCENSLQESLEKIKNLINEQKYNLQNR
jgi:phosphomannomutase